jgi:hypothetical protein
VSAWTSDEAVKTACCLKMRNVIFRHVFHDWNVSVSRARHWRIVSVAGGQRKRGMVLTVLHASRMGESVETCVGVVRVWCVCTQGDDRQASRTVEPTEGLVE